MTLKKTLRFLLAHVIFFLSTPVFGFDYLEHSYFSDLACVDAQKKSENLLETDKDAARFLGLSLFCPIENIDQYCKNGYKQAKSMVNQVEGSEFGVTLGDIAALPDHISDFGPIKNILRAGKGGVSESLLEWISVPGNIGGVIEDVAEDACEFDTHIFWANLNREIIDDISSFEKEGLPVIHENHLSAIARRRPKKGPNDPATKYTVDNPHYLDLVLRNHTHFGAAAYDAWLGFHQVGADIAERTCEEIVDFQASEIEDLAQNLDLDDRDWSDLNASKLARSACDLLGVAISKRVRLLDLDGTNNPALKAFLARVKEGDKKARDALVSAMFGALFRGAGLHYLQDGIAGGHLRTIRSRESLLEVRHDHDVDNEAGVIAVYSSGDTTTPFVAFGDSFLLGGRFGNSHCKSMTLDSKMNDGDVTDCLLRFQRALLVGTSSENLVHFVLGRQRSSAFSPNQKVSVPGEIQTNPRSRTHTFGSLPVPAPTFSFESLAFRFGFSTRDSSPQLGLKLEALTELDDPAHWMVSYQLGLNYQPRYYGGESLFADFAYAFHYRFFARATLDLVPSVYGGFHGLDSQTQAFFGFAPALGITFLPEGWIDIPLEVNISYRLPIDLFHSEEGFKFGLLEDHWIHFGFGLAFMH